VGFGPANGRNRIGATFGFQAGQTGPRRDSRPVDEGEVVSRHRFVPVLAVLISALPACGGGGGGGGDAHSLGEEAAVGYSQTDPAARTTLGVTVLAVRKGTQQQLTDGGYEVDEDARDTTPYYVDVRYENQGQATVKRNLPISLEDSDGNLIGSTLIFNYGGKPFGPCKEINEGELAPGQSYESCTLFLVPEDTDIGQVSFLSDKGPGNEPEFVYWESSS
jgi:hypothetical protein